jgi:hypothetical protein
MGTSTTTPDWGTPLRILFRFTCVYLVLYLFPFFVDAINPWNALVPWVGKHLFQVEITVGDFTGSGDRTFDYVQLFCCATLAAAGTAVWTLLDRKRTNYVRLHRWLRVWVRFWLAASMLTYGAFKVIPSQFPSPDLGRLVQPFGDASPMGLLWTFMGASVGYNVFCGGGEMLGGLLLTARRTTLLGALVCLGVLSNVVMLNFCYDVPVKLFSLHLSAMAVFLLAPDLRRLADLFVLNRPVAPIDLRPVFIRTWLRRTALALRTVLVVGFTGWCLFMSYQARTAYGDLAPRPPLYGIWNVEEFEVDGEVRPPLVTDTQRWRRVIFDYPGRVGIELMAGPGQRYNVTLDADRGTLELGKREDAAWKSTFVYQQPEAGLLTLEGTFDGHRIRGRLRVVDGTTFLLTTRGFHWVNEYPFNR